MSARLRAERCGSAREGSSKLLPGVEGVASASSAAVLAWKRGKRTLLSPQHCAKQGWPCPVLMLTHAKRTCIRHCPAANIEAFAAAASEKARWRWRSRFLR
eukprot:278335-Chlamydomonas_euryale.AAC.20